MMISVKCQYALRAVYEIARSDSGRVMTICEIATAQRVPQRYLEGILNQLRKGGILEAQRGRAGGYRLARESSMISVGQVVRLIDGPMRAVSCVERTKPTNCPLRNNCAFLPTWEKVQSAVDETLDAAVFSELLKMEEESLTKEGQSYVI